MYHREQLRRERQAEYQAFLRQQQATNRGSNTRAPTTIPSSDSLEEKRRALARERESELLSCQSHDQLPQHHYTASADNNTHREKMDHQRNTWSTADRQRVHVNRGHTTSHQFREVPSERYDQRERRIQEERQYLGHHDGSHFLSGEMDRRGHWNKGSGAPRQVHFEHDYNSDVERIEAQEPRKGHNPRGQWDEEEEGLIQWAREQGKSRDPGIRARTPPSYPSTNRNADKINNRSISAPVVAGIAALGAGDTENDRRRKQKEYAEQLRAQMKEKEMTKKRERAGLSSDYQASDYQATSVGHKRARDPQQRPSHNSKFNTDTDEYKSSTMRGHPYRHERVHFSPDRDSRHDHSKYDSHHETHYRPVDSSSKTSYPSMPPYWPGYYYGGFPYPPPSNFPLLPPNGVPFYPPPPPSLPPSLSNPYLAAYHPPPPAGEFRSESKGGMKRSQEGLKDHLSPRKVQERGDEESKFNSSGGSEISKISKELYRSELLEQMREKRESKQREQREKSEFERRKELEVYDPFGKGGCGAPLKDKRGHLVTDLKQMKKVNDERMIIGLPSTTPLPGEVAEGGAAGVLNNSLTEQQSSPQSSYDIRRSKELQSKIVQEGYREVLEQQMREREELKRKEKENKSKEEELEAERIQKELKILEEKYKQEKEREREKQHELKMKNEAMKREKEEKERAELERKQEEERREQEALRLEAEQKKQRLIDNMERQLSSHKQVRSNSPPIPTLRKLKSQFASPPTAPTHPQLQQRSSSPPVPTLRHKQLLDGTASQPQAEHIVSSVYNTATQPSTQQLRSSSPIVPALRNKLSAVSASGQPPQAKRSSSAHSGLPQTHGTGNDPSSHSAHQLPRLPIPQAHLPTSASNPTPPTALAPPAVQPPLPVQEDEMENVLKNLHSMRQKLENERQKVSIHPQPHPVATSHPPAANVDSKAVSNTGTVHPSIKPQFLRPRLAAPRKTSSTSGNPYPGKAQQAVEHRQRRKWQASPNEPSKAPPIPQLPHTHTNVQNNQQIIRNEGMFPTDTLKPLPVWLRPGGSGGQNSEDGFVLPHYRAPSVGGQSQFSIATLDVDSMARRNEERMQRLENILNRQSRDSRTPQTILSDFLARNSRARDATQSNNTHPAPSMQPSSFYSTQRVKDRNTDFTSESRPDCETGYHPVAASTPTD